MLLARKNGQSEERCSPNKKEAEQWAAPVFVSICGRITTHFPGRQDRFFYAYARHFRLVLSTFSTLTLDGSAFLDLRWIPQSMPGSARLSNR